MTRSRQLAPYAGLLLLTLAVYFPVVQYDFVSYDDPIYVSRNIHVLRGLNAADFAWGASTTRNGQWHPMVWWSYQLDSYLFGPSARGFHLSNLLYHLLGVCLLYSALRAMNLSPATAFLTAALYGIHPLRVESVAWISERKGLLAAMFWFAGMWAYAWHARRPGWRRMGVVALLMLLGLMSKQTLVSFPLVLLLLDYWPLVRLRGAVEQDSPEASAAASPKRSRRSPESAASTSISLGQAALEKTPLFALSLLFCGIAYATQASEGAVNSLEESSLATRLLNAPATYAFHLTHVVWPLNLSPIYLPPGNLPLVALAAGALLAAITLLATLRRRVLPAAFVGWFWYLIGLFPLSGIVPLGTQWTADRYTDMPLVGVYLVLAQGLVRLAQRRASYRVPVYGLAIATLALLAIANARLLPAWRNAETLMAHAARVDPQNPLALTNLGSEYLEQGKFAQAREVLQSAVNLAPDNPHARNNLGLALAKLGQTSAAMEQFQQALELNPHFAEAHLNLGNCWLATDHARATECFRTAARLKPDYSEAHNNLGALLAATDPAAARFHFQRSLEIWPRNADAHCNLANLYARAGELDRALSAYEQALAIDANHATARRNWEIVRRGQSGDAASRDAPR